MTTKRTVVRHYLTGVEMEAKTPSALSGKKSIDESQWGGSVFLFDDGELFYIQPYIPLIISTPDGDSYYYDEELH